MSEQGRQNVLTEFKKQFPEDPRLGTNFSEYVAQLDEIFGDY